MAKRIEIRKDKTITINELFKSKERYHKGLSRLPFEEKIGILMQLWKIASKAVPPTR